jgi:5'(3')-deoxyribonucleotidase
MPTKTTPPDQNQRKRRRNTVPDKGLVLLVDMDGVAVDLMTHVLKVYNAGYDDSLTLKDLAKVNGSLYEEKDAFYKLFKPEARPFMERIFHKRNIFFESLPMEGFVKAISEIRGKGVRVIFVSCPPPDAPYAAMEKWQWLKVHLPWIGTGDYIFTDSKHMIKGDILVDDSARYIDQCRDVMDVVVFDQPWNQSVEGTRVKNWKELAAHVSRKISRSSSKPKGVPKSRKHSGTGNPDKSK